MSLNYLRACPIGCDRPLLITEIEMPEGQLLRCGGILVIGTANTASWTFMAMKSRWEYFHIDKHGGHVSFFNPDSMKILARKGGFVIDKIKTRSVSFFERDACHPVIYRTFKIISELIEAPSRWLGKGHDMLVFMRKGETSR